MTLGGRRFLLASALVAASVCLALGVSLPIIRLTRFVFFTSDHSLISAVNALVRSGQAFIGLVILVFGIFLPVIRLLYLLLLALLPEQELIRLSRQLRALEWIGKWSMHDVLVLALSICFLKSQAGYDARSLSGLYFFVASVLLMMLSYTWLRRPDTGPVHGAPKAGLGGSPLRGFAFSVVTILAIVFFALGIMLPAIRFTTAYVWTNEHSIATVIWALYASGDISLFVIILTFSIVLPFLKLLYLLTFVSAADLSNRPQWRSIAVMEWLGRYSMTDVMVLALVVFYINASGYSEASVLPGIYFFAASALMTMLAYGWANTVGHGAARPDSLQARLAGLGPLGT